MYVRVQATPSAKRELVSILELSTLAISVREPALHNLANRRILELVARHYGVPGARVHMLSGHRSRTKLCVIEDFH